MPRKAKRRRPRVPLRRCRLLLLLSFLAASLLLLLCQQQRGVFAQEEQQVEQVEQVEQAAAKDDIKLTWADDRTELSVQEVIDRLRSPRKFPTGHTGVSFHGVRLTDDGFREIAEHLGGALQRRDALENDPHADRFFIQGLHLGNTNVNDGHVAAIVDALQEGGNDVLEQLHLGETEIGDEGAAAIARLLAAGKGKLASLYLGYTAVGDEGALRLAGALKSNRVLKGLSLVQTRVGDEGAVALADVLSADPDSRCALEQLFLAASRVTEMGSSALAAAVRANKSIKMVVVAENELQLPVDEALRENQEEAERLRKQEQPGREVVEESDEKALRGDGDSAPATPEEEEEVDSVPAHVDAEEALETALP